MSNYLSNMANNQTVRVLSSWYKQACGKQLVTKKITFRRH